MLEDIGEGTKDYQILTSGILANLGFPLAAFADALEYDRIALDNGALKAMQQEIKPFQSIDMAPLMKNLQTNIGTETLKKFNSTFAEQMKGVLSSIDMSHFYDSIPKTNSEAISGVMSNAMSSVDPEVLKGAMSAARSIQGEENE
jgi:hypothetical protein